MSVFICKYCNSMLYNLPALKIFIRLLVITYFLEISVIDSISNLRNFWADLQVSVMLQPSLEIFAIDSWQRLGIMSSKSCRTGYYRLVISRQGMSILRPSLKVHMILSVTISKVSSSEGIAENNITVLNLPSVAILIMKFCNEIWRSWLPSEWCSKKIVGLYQLVCCQ